MTHRPVRSLLIALLTFAPAAALGCPESSLSCYNGTNSQFTSTPTAELACLEVTGSGDVGYDLTQGTSHTSGTSTPQTSRNSNATDDYVLAGTPAGVGVRLMAVVDGAITTHGRNALPDSSLIIGNGYIGVFRDSAQTSLSAVDAALGAHGIEQWTRTVQIPIVFFPGVAQRITIASNVVTQYDGSASVVATLHFEGLPPGATITSCNGFQQGGVVPAIVASWGKLKAAYR